MKQHTYDLVVLGSGPAGEKAALSARKRGMQVAIVEPQFIGGLCTHTGTLPSKAFREAVLQLTHYRERFMNLGSAHPVTMNDLKTRVDWVREKKVSVIHKRLQKRKVDIIGGWGRFIDDHHVGVYNDGGDHLHTLQAKQFVIATGTTPFKRPSVQFDGRKIFYTDNLLAMQEIPESLTVIGAGIIGSELASIFAMLGTRVTIVDSRSGILTFLDNDIHRNLLDHLGQRNVSLELNEEVESADVNATGIVEIHLKSGKTLRSDTALFCEYRLVQTGTLNLDVLSVDRDQRGLIKVDREYRTTQPHIFAAGDVIGHPALASTSFEQGRAAGINAAGEESFKLSANYPVGIYTVPEISYIGPTERELRERGVPIVVGGALYGETARGAILGAMDGFLKLIVHRETKQILAVHVIGDQASELVHLGQAVIQLKGTVLYFLENVFNFPTLAETYKYAAISALNRLDESKGHSKAPV